MSLSATAQITVDQPNGPIVLVGGSGSGTFTLTGDGPLHLDHGIVADKTTLAVLRDATVKLTRDGPDPNIPANLAKGQPLLLRADVTNVKDASAVTIPLFNGSVPLQKQLEADTADAPLNVTLSGDGASGTPLALSPGKPAFVTLKNGDAEAYMLRWKFRYRELELCSTVALLGNGSARVALKAGSDVYSWGDLIRPSSQTGHLELGLDTREPCCKDDPSCKAAAGQNDPARATLPTRNLPVSLTMQRATATRTTIYADIYVIACLIIGGLISLLASAVLPNSLRKSAFRRQLRDLASRTTGVSLRVDSNLRVLLRLERNRIREALDSTWLISPTAGASLDDIATQIEQLTKRLEVAERIDDLRAKLEASYGTSPPSVVEEVHTSLQAAADAMHSYALSSDDVGAATKSMDAASKSLGTLDNSADLAQQIALKFTELRTRLDNFLPNYTDLKTAMPGVFGVLREPFDDAKKITPRMVYAIDYCIAAINTALDFAVVRQELPVEDKTPPADASKGAATPPPGVQPNTAENQGQTSPLQQSVAPGAQGHAPQGGAGLVGGTGATSADAAEPVKYVTPEPPNDVVIKARMHQEELTRLLSSMAWQALREARLLVQEMREDTYEEDVLEELNSPRAWVAFETMRARPYLPIRFYVHYLKWGRETRAAMERLSFRWSFPSDLKEEGTRVCHYFTGKEKVEGADQLTEWAGKPPKTMSPTDFPGFYKRLFPGFFKRPRLLHVEVTVNIRTSLPGGPTKPGPTLKGDIEIEPEESRWDFARLLAEALRFAIAFGVALAGLLSGGIEQIGKLDLIPATLAIVALGFTADAVKNVLTQASPATSAKQSSPTSP